MKLKLDFITNSSSVSFVCIGSNVNIKEIPEEYLKRIAKKHNIPVDEVMDDPYEMMEELVKGSDLEFSFGSEYDDHDSAMIGISYGNMNDDETLSDFRRRVRLQILEVTGVKDKPYHIEECWRDG